MQKNILNLILNLQNPLYTVRMTNVDSINSKLRRKRMSVWLKTISIDNSAKLCRK